MAITIWFTSSFFNYSQDIAIAKEFNNACLLIPNNTSKQIIQFDVNKYLTIPVSGIGRNNYKSIPKIVSKNDKSNLNMFNDNCEYGDYIGSMEYANEWEIVKTNLRVIVSAINRSEAFFHGNKITVLIEGDSCSEVPQLYAVIYEEDYFFFSKEYYKNGGGHIESMSALNAYSKAGPSGPGSTVSTIFDVPSDWLQRIAPHHFFVRTGWADKMPDTFNFPTTEELPDALEVGVNWALRTLYHECGKLPKRADIYGLLKPDIVPSRSVGENFPLSDKLVNWWKHPILHAKFMIDDKQGFVLIPDVDNEEVASRFRDTYRLAAAESKRQDEEWANRKRGSRSFDPNAVAMGAALVILLLASGHYVNEVLDEEGK
nr:hypothetical protein [uncultured Cohaesibacter sp.]